MDIDFSSLGQQTAQMINDAQTPNPPASSPAAPATPPVGSLEQPPAALQQQTPAIPGQVTPPSVADQKIGQTTNANPLEKVYEVDFGGGRVEKLTALQIQQLQQAGLRQADYTRKTQEVAAQRQEVETVMGQLMQERQRIQQLLTNPQMLIAEAQRMIEAQKPIDPNQPMTVQHAAQMGQAIAQQMAQIQQNLEQRAMELEQHAQRVVEDRLQVANYAEAINQTLNSVYTQHPVLKAFPEMEQVLRYRVAMSNPQSPEEAHQAFQTIGKQLAEEVGRVFQQSQQQQAVAKAQLQQGGIEPPGGAAAPLQQTQNYRKGNGDLDWNALRGAAISLTQT